VQGEDVGGVAGAGNEAEYFDLGLDGAVVAEDLHPVVLASRGSAEPGVPET
jgi:hypothetical protein